MRCLITGSGGLVGSALSRIMIDRGIECLGFGKLDLDVTDTYVVERTLRKENPDIVFHCAAFTAVDRAESERTSAFAVNKDGTRNIALACKQLEARLVFFSTDYVFNGAKRTPYLPWDEPDPLSVYGESKLAGENEVSTLGIDALLIRTSWLYGAMGENFVRRVIRRAREGKTLRLVEDQIGSPTWAKHLAEVTLDLVARGVSGTYHVSDAGEASWYELGREVLSILHLQADVRPISTIAWEMTPRPSYSVLDTRKAEEVIGRRMLPWREALKKYLEEELE